MRRKRRWMGAWILCIYCNVKELKWRILEGVLLLLLLLLWHFIFVQFIKTKYAQFHAQHTQNVCKKLPLSCRYFS